MLRNLSKGQNLSEVLRQTVLKTYGKVFLLYHGCMVLTSGDLAENKTKSVRMNNSCDFQSPCKDLQLKANTVKYIGLRQEKPLGMSAFNHRGKI